MNTKKSFIAFGALMLVVGLLVGFGLGNKIGGKAEAVALTSQNAFADALGNAKPGQLLAQARDWNFNQNTFNEFLDRYALPHTSAGDLLVLMLAAVNATHQEFQAFSSKTIRPTR